MAPNIRMSVRGIRINKMSVRVLEWVLSTQTVSWFISTEAADVATENE